jgi:hypothetical protein
MVLRRHGKVIKIVLASLYRKPISIMRMVSIWCLAVKIGKSQIVTVHLFAVLLSANLKVVLNPDPVMCQI